MRMSKMLIPAVTLAGALALAGCGGGGTPALTAAQIAANEAADKAATDTESAVNATFALDLTADDASDSVGDALALIVAARAAVAAAPESAREGLEDQLAQASRFATLAGQLLTTQENARTAAEKAKEDLEEAGRDLMQAMTDAEEAAKEAALAAEKAQEAAVSQAVSAAEKEAAQEAATEAMKVKEAADALLAAETAKVTAAQGQLTAANGRITELEGQIGNLNTQLTNLRNEKEREETARETAETEAARAEAAALYAGLVANSSNATAIGAVRAIAYTLADFNKAEGEKDYQKITPEGASFEDTAMGDGEPAAASGIPKGAYDIIDGSGSASDGDLGRNDATSTAFSQGPTVEEHDTGDSGIFTTSGEWLGVRGTFYCTADCDSQSGNPLGESWHFKPGNVKDRVKAKDVAWGWWVEPAAGADLIHVRAFVDHGGLTLTTTAPTGDGSATFEGDARGAYAIPGEAGSFTAEATLTANFTGQDTLSGEIKNFKDADGNDKTGWSVALQENNLVAGGLAGYSDSENLRSSTVWTRDGRKGDAMVNAWSAELYGGDDDAVSTHALGTFEAQHQGSHMVGAFGTEKKSESAE